MHAFVYFTPGTVLFIVVVTFIVGYALGRMGR